MHLISLPIAYLDYLDSLCTLSGPKGKSQGVKDPEIVLAIRHLETGKSVFPENGPAKVTCSPT